MPELPDVDVYVEAIGKRIISTHLERALTKSPFVLRTFDPPLDALEGKVARAVSRLGKRIVVHFEDDLFLVIHLMIAGRFRWFDVGADAGAGKIELARFVFERGTLMLTEAGTTKRAAIHVVLGREALAQHDPGGLEVLGDANTPGASLADSSHTLARENRTLKRALCDPRLFSGIGNAYSDEILHGARLSPLKLTRSLSSEERERLHAACTRTLTHWRGVLRTQFGLDADNGRSPGRFPGAGEITAFRPDFAVHGKFDTPCPVCNTKVQRIVYAENECNYCPTCQTGGKVLADRSMSRLLKDDWPWSVEELE